MRSLLRTLLFPLAIIGIAAALTWNARPTAAPPAPAGAVEAFVRAGLDDVDYGATEPMLVDMLRRAWPQKVATIHVSPAQGKDSKDGATHRAELRVDGQIKLVVLLHYDADPALRRFVGYSKQ